MKNKTKRIVSAICALAMCAATVPAAAFATGNDDARVVNASVSSTDTGTTVTMNIQFKAGDEVIAGGDYFVPAGVQNYSVLEQYVPEGYKMTVSGDFTAEAGGKLVVNIVAAVFYRDDAAALEVRDHRHRLAAVAPERKEELVEFFIVCRDLADDILFSGLGLCEVHCKTPFPGIPCRSVSII